MIQRNAIRQAYGLGCVILIVMCCLATSTTEVQAAKGGKGGGNSGGSTVTIYQVELSGELEWQNLPEDPPDFPLFRMGRLDNDTAERFLVNRITPADCATQASMRLNFLDSDISESDLNSCFPPNATSGGRVYGGTLMGTTESGVMELRLNIPDALNKSGKSTSYRLAFNVSNGPLDLATTLRALGPGEQLILTLTGWSLNATKGKPGSACSGSDTFLDESGVSYTKITITAVQDNSNPCSP